MILECLRVPIPPIPSFPVEKVILEEANENGGDIL